MEPPSHVPRLQRKAQQADLDVLSQDKEKLRNTFIGSIDQGTTSSRFLIFNGLGHPVAQHQIEFSQLYPHSG